MARFTRTWPPPIVTRKNYGAFKSHVRYDFERCCAYCYLHENHFPRREDEFEIDHFCPQSEFKKVNILSNDFRNPHNYYNLYWSCKVCNSSGNKSDKWPPPELLEKGICFVDLCRDSWEHHYLLREDGFLVSLTPSAEWTIQSVNLNDENLIIFRAKLLKNGNSLDKSPD